MNCVCVCADVSVCVCARASGVCVSNSSTIVFPLENQSKCELFYVWLKLSVVRAPLFSLFNYSKHKWQIKPSIHLVSLARYNNVTFVSLIIFFLTLVEIHRRLELAKISKSMADLLLYDCVVFFSAVVFFFAHERFSVPRIPFQLYRYWLVCSNICSFVRFILLLIKMPIIIDLVSIAMVMGALGIAAMRELRVARGMASSKLSKFDEMWRLICTSY